ncbi:MAG: conserved hypothetical protein [Methanobrevibacter sp. CfCl-M3]
MNFNKIKTICKKEMKETLRNKMYLASFVFNFILVIAILIMMFRSLPSEGIKLVGNIMIIVLPSFAMVIISLTIIQEKFWNDKISFKLENMLTLPISIKEIWLGKILSIIGLSYPYSVFLSMLLTVIFTLNVQGSPSLTNIFLSIVVLPSGIILFNVVSSYMALRFKSQHVLTLVFYLVIGLFTLSFYKLKDITTTIINSNINISMIAVAVLIAIVVIMSIFMFLISQLDIEKTIEL